MKQELIECPKCKRSDCAEVREEVDIGVCVQTFLVGYDCPDCGQISVYPACGALEYELHQDWCNQIKELSI